MRLSIPIVINIALPLALSFFFSTIANVAAAAVLVPSRISISYTNTWNATGITVVTHIVIKKKKSGTNFLRLPSRKNIYQAEKQSSFSRFAAICFSRFSFEVGAEEGVRGGGRILSLLKS